MGHRRLRRHRIRVRGVSLMTPACRRVPRYRRCGPVAATAGVLLALLAAAACSSGPAPKPRPSQTPFPYGLVITQCALDHGLIPAGYLHAGYGESYWLRNGRIVPNYRFADWWEEEMARITVDGQTLEDWELGAEQQGRLPAQLCGTASPVPAFTPGT
jgi:hypothetical protein